MAWPLLFQDMDVPFRAHIFEDLWPHRNTDLPEMGRAQQIHVGPGLPDASPDGQWNLIVEDGLVVGKIQEVFLA